MQNLRPRVHSVFEKSSSTWQYVVADQETRHCVILNPTHNYDAHETVLSTASPDTLLDIVRRHGYIVDWLLETQPTGSTRTAVYYTRMQLLERQGFAPKTCGGSNVSFLRRNFARKYGSGRSKFTTTFEEEFRDGDTKSVGNMRVVALEVDGPKRQHLGYVIGQYLFGFHYFTHLSGLECILPDSDITALRLRHIWLSLAKILSLGPECRVYFDHTTGSHDGKPYNTVRDHLRCNQFVEMSEPEFIKYWKAKLSPRYNIEQPVSKRDVFRRSNRLGLPST